jgi:HD superfamily phosphodiesterase
MQGRPTNSVISFGVYNLARQLAEDKAYDDDVLYAAAWLHDLGSSSATVRKS